MEVFLFHCSKGRSRSTSWFVASGSNAHIAVLSKHSHEPEHSTVADQGIAVQTKFMQFRHSSERARRDRLQVIIV